jgi:hypothetical protein
LIDVEAVTPTGLVGCTIMRQHWRITFAFNVTADQWRYGMILGRQNDIGGVRPDPAAAGDRDLEWVLNDVAFPSLSGAAVDAETTTSLDLKSRRRFHGINDRYLLCVRNNTAAQTHFTPFARVLLALP